MSQHDLADDRQSQTSARHLVAPWHAEDLVDVLEVNLELDARLRLR